MPDRKTVLTWLEICGENRDCSVCCPYGDGTGEDEMSTCREDLMADAFALLKEQEEKEMHPCEKCQEFECDGCLYADD